jgi:carbon-monoxide dehydrogenase large subunit
MGPYHGVGRPVSTFVMERLIDMAARRLEVDPVELHLRNLVQAEDFPYRTAPGIVWDRSAFVETVTSACDGMDYKTSATFSRNPRGRRKAPDCDPVLGDPDVSL